MLTRTARTAGTGDEYTFESRQYMVNHLAQSIANKLSRAIDARGQASLLVSGGTTPQLLFDTLCTQKIAWSQVWISLVDERWVPLSDHSSNDRLVHEHLLQSNAKDAHFVSMRGSAENIEEAVSNFREKLKVIPSPFDVVLLGMGEDGHTASLFPCSDEINQGLDLHSELGCISVTPRSAPHHRITLTLPTLLNSRWLGLLITGKCKWAVYKKAIANISTESEKTMPIRAFLNQHVAPVDVFWAP